MGAEKGEVGERRRDSKGSETGRGRGAEGER